MVTMWTLLVSVCAHAQPLETTDGTPLGAGAGQLQASYDGAVGVGAGLGVHDRFDLLASSDPALGAKLLLVPGLAVEASASPLDGSAGAVLAWTVSSDIATLHVNGGAQLPAAPFASTAVEFLPNAPVITVAEAVWDGEGRLLAGCYAPLGPSLILDVAASWQAPDQLGGQAGLTVSWL